MMKKDIIHGAHSISYFVRADIMKRFEKKKEKEKRKKIKLV